MIRKYLLVLLIGLVVIIGFVFPQAVRSQLNSEMLQRVALEGVR